MLLQLTILTFVPLHSGMAIRMFQGLQAESDTPLSCKELSSQTGEARDAIWRGEIQRRTHWACFAMDRTMSCGKDRPISLDTNAMTVCLPPSEDEFDLGTSASEPLTYSRLVSLSLERPIKEFTIGDYYTVTIRSLDIFSKACKWVADGGRRLESALGKCPWEPDSDWHQINKELIQWRGILHDRLKYPQTPLFMYIHRRQGERFAFVNLIHYLRYVSMLDLTRLVTPWPSTDDGFL